ncbi:MAG: protease pro-enzyme activation domain-containing protein [Bryobacteraceae bacterium]
MDHTLILFKPSSAQQADLDQLLADQQNPSSPLFRRWLTPEEFGNRFGLSASDHSKVVAWLASEGLTVNESGRARNWVAFSGTAAQVSKTLHTSLRRYRVDGETHFANSNDPAVPEALADVVGGFLGLNDFYPKPLAIPVSPEFNSGTSHYLVPEDYATIYNLAPLYQAGVDGTGQSIAVVGASDISLNDIRSFRTRYNLPANDPKLVLVGADPGGLGSSANLEADLDLEWAGAIAPKATIYFVYSANAYTALVQAINLNVAPIISVSFGTCEVNWPPPYRSMFQQANAQGITILAASGDSGGAGCDTQGSEPLATRGMSVEFPAVLPEVTGVGGTQFVEGSGAYWATTNSANSGSALSYIPEKAWNESSTTGLAATGGGVSRFYPRPAWQAGPGVPNDNFRHVPDVAMSAASHDAYYIYFAGTFGGVAGTSASTPSFAGIVALLNQYVVAKGQQVKPGLGNINPQLYRLAQGAPSVFHDTTVGDNLVPCSQDSPDCVTGTLGYAAAPGYDMATGLGSVDANALATQWNTATNGVRVTLVSSAAKGTLNDTVDLTATVAAASGIGVPTGTVAFVANGVSLGSVPLTSGGTAVLPAIPLYLLGTGTSTVAAQYSGDAAFSSGGATTRIQVTLPATGAAVTVTGPSSVWPTFPDAQGPTWSTTLTVHESAGVPAMVTGFTIDGAAQPLSQYFPSPTITAKGTLSSIILFRNLAPPVTRTFGLTGVDATGLNWSRQLVVSYFPAPISQNFTLMATPLAIAQNTSADSSCQWSTQINVDDQDGCLNVMTGFWVGGANHGVDLASKLVPVFGTTRIDAWGGLQGVLCFDGVTPGGVTNIEVDFSTGLIEQLTVSFSGPPAKPTKITANPASVSMTATGSAQTAAGTLNIGLADTSQSWTASVFPANRSTAWLSLSQISGTGPAQVVLTANRAGFEPGAYRATVVIQSPNAMPQYVNVPVMFVLGAGASAPNILAVVNAATSQPGSSPGALVSVYGTNLASAIAGTVGAPLPYTLGGVTATINGLPAPLLYVSPNQINLQIPYAAGAGPAVIGVTSNGLAGGLQTQLVAASPGIFLESNGNLIGNPVLKPGDSFALYATGVGEISPQLKSAWSPTAGTALSGLPKPLLPVSVTVGGVQAFVPFLGITPGLVGTAQINFTVPMSVPAGKQPVVVTVAGVSSPAGNITVQAP